MDFDKEKIKDTQFHHQRSLKLVVQCKSPKPYPDYLRAEYLVYKLLSLVTPYSFKVRWVNVTFLGEKKPRTETAFFIERKSRLAKRLGLGKTDIERIRPSELDTSTAALVSLFQYMIANPDFSLAAAVEGSCCHNAKLLMNDQEQYFPVIYDFDSSGVINTKYAIPNQTLKIRKVTDRVFRGYCYHNPYLAEERAKLLGLEANMIALIVDDPVISPKFGQKMTKYLTRSFQILREDDSYEKNIIGKCRGKKKA